MSLVAINPKPNAPVELREVPQPELEPNSALLTVELSEVCGTDVYLQRGLLFLMYIGHAKPAGTVLSRKLRLAARNEKSMESHTDLITDCAAAGRKRFTSNPARSVSVSKLSRKRSWLAAVLCQRPCTRLNEAR